MRPCEEKRYKQNIENYNSLVDRLKNCPAFNISNTRLYCKINGLDAQYDSTSNTIFSPIFTISLNDVIDKHTVYYNKKRGLIYQKILYCGYNSEQITEKEELYVITFPDNLPSYYVNPVLHWKSTNPFCFPPFYYGGPTGSCGADGASLLPKQSQSKAL